MTHPALMPIAEAARALGTDEQGIMHYVRTGRLTWNRRTRTFLTDQVHKLANEIERELRGTALGSIQFEMGGEPWQWQGARLVSQSHRRGRRPGRCPAQNEDLS